MSDYGSAGVMAVMTPQANTTVEPEFWALMPPHWSMLTARLTSEKPDIQARLEDYGTKFATTSDQFANAPVDVLTAACTGVSYLMGAEAEQDLIQQVEARRGVPFVTAALATVAALRALGARDVALLSPYPDPLTTAARRYWQGHGFEVRAVAGPQPETDAFHPIYAMPGAGVLAAYETLAREPVDVVLMLGTGMATLAPLLQGRDMGLMPALSCNLALVWAACQKRRWDELGDADLAGWMAGAHWQDRLSCLFPIP